MRDEHKTTHNWADSFADPKVRSEFEFAQGELSLLGQSLEAVAGANVGTLLGQGVGLLAEISKMMISVDDWNDPYRPWFSSPDRRSRIPSDLSDQELHLISEMCEWVPNDWLQARAFDILALRSSGGRRAEFFKLSLEALTRYGMHEQAWFHECEVWDRALDTGIRFGKPLKGQVKSLENLILCSVLGEGSGNFRAQSARLLHKHRLCRESAKAIADSLSVAKDEQGSEPTHAQFAAAFDWYMAIGDKEAAFGCLLNSAQRFIGEAEAKEGPNGETVSSEVYKYEQALELVRRIPRSFRQANSVGHLADELEKKIRAAGIDAVKSMHRFESEPVDLSQTMCEAEDRVRGLPVEQALFAFSNLFGFSSFKEDFEMAREVTENSPLFYLATHKTYAADGRVIHRDDKGGEDPVLGVDPAFWTQMLMQYRMRIPFVVRGLIIPAYAQIALEHRLSLRDFYDVVQMASIVPVSRSRQFARGLYYGFVGDFSTAAQLLAPQIENLVRHHLRAAGVSTSQMSKEGVESEIALGGLLEREELLQIFGQDLVYEFRGLFADPLGLNLRNEIAHGLREDSLAESEESVYAWWVCLRIVYIPFWGNVTRVKEETGKP